MNIFTTFYLFRITVLLLIVGGSAMTFVGCSSADLSFVNEVKRFEPKWMSLSEKVSFVNRNLTATQRRYEQDLKEVEPAFPNSAANSRTQIYALRGEYRSVIATRDSIQSSFEVEQGRFVDAANRFNAWQSKVMKNKLDPAQASVDFEDFKKEFISIDIAVGALQGEIITNIESHNSIMSQISRKLNVHTNYSIDPK